MMLIRSWSFNPKQRQTLRQTLVFETDEQIEPHAINEVRRVAKMRIEKDSLGSVEVSKEALYGAQTVRSVQNFPMTGQKIDEAMIHALSEVKKASDQANFEVNELSLEQIDLIVQVCDEILEGAHRKAFPTDAIQGGAGTR